MPSRRAVWPVVAVALVQALLGGVVLITREEPLDPFGPLQRVGGESAPAARDEPQGESPDLTQEPGAAPDPNAVAAEPSSPSQVGAPPANPPTTTGAPPQTTQPDGGMSVVSTYAELTPEEQRSVKSDAPYEEIVEGRLPQGWYWRLSAHDQSGEQVCANTRVAKQGIPGSGRGGVCRPKDHWEIQVMSVGDSQGDFVIVTAYATVQASKFRLVGEDGQVGEVEGRFESSMGTSFFVAGVACPAADLERLEAVNEAGRVISTLRFGEDSPGRLSYLCRASNGG